MSGRLPAFTGWARAAVEVAGCGPRSRVIPFSFQAAGRVGIVAEDAPETLALSSETKTRFSISISP